MTTTEIQLLQYGGTCSVPVPERTCNITTTYYPPSIWGHLFGARAYDRRSAHQRMVTPSIWGHLFGARADLLDARAQKVRAPSIWGHLFGARAA